MNELLFFSHIFVVIGFLYVAFKRGSTALTALVALQIVLANLFVVKQMTFFGLSVTCGDVYTIGSLLALNVLQEFFGKNVAKQAIGISLLASLFFVVMAQMHLFYVPSPFDETHGAFTQILSSMPRIIISSIGVYWLVQQFDYRFFGWLQGKIGALPLRLAITLVVSQTLDTILFSFLGLYGIVSSISEVVLVSLLTKWLAIGASVPFTAFLKKLGKPAHE